MVTASELQAQLTALKEANRDKEKELKKQLEKMKRKEEDANTRAIGKYAMEIFPKLKTPDEFLTFFKDTKAMLNGENINNQDKAILMSKNSKSDEVKSEKVEDKKDNTPKPHEVYGGVQKQTSQKQESIKQNTQKPAPTNQTANTTNTSVPQPTIGMPNVSLPQSSNIASSPLHFS